MGTIPGFITLEDLYPPKNLKMSFKIKINLILPSDGLHILPIK
jgi:hypothetical protein